MAGPGSVVEGTNPHLLVQITEPDGGAGAVDAGGLGAGTLRPVLLLHGFASSSELNWQTSGWIPALAAAGRRVITVDLPGHGGSAAPEDLDSYRPSRIRADLLQVLQDAGVTPLADNDPASGLDIVGYSLGSRLAWEFGATQPELVHRMVLGGPGSGDPLADFDLNAAREAAAGGEPVADPGTAELLRMAQLVPQNRLTALFRMVEAIKEEPFTPSAAVPAMPLLLVAGDRDSLAATAPELAALSGSAELMLLPARTHTNAVTSRAFKNAALEFLNS